MANKHFSRSLSKPAVAECPSCGNDVRVTTPKLGFQVTCSNCKMIWEVIWLDPVELDWPYFEGEDDDDDRYDRPDDFDEWEDDDDDWDD